MKVINLAGHNMAVGHPYARQYKIWFVLKGFLLGLVQTPLISG